MTPHVHPFAGGKRPLTAQKPVSGISLINVYLCCGSAMTADETIAPDSPRSTRPKDRKQQILSAAADLFVRDGFPQVTMGAIAEKVGITAGALYRHYPNKAELLASVVRRSFESFPPVERNAPFDEVIADSCSVAVSHRELSPLWTRQLQYLPVDDQTELRARLRAMNRAFGELIRSRREDLTAREAGLLAWSIQSILASPGHFTVSIPQPEFAAQLASACHSVAFADIVGSKRSSTKRDAVLRPASRRERLLQGAITLFGQNGIHKTSMEDIGAAAGVSGPSLYTHFDSKEAILDAALDRGTHTLWITLNSALRSNDDPRNALREIVHGYVELVNSWLSIATLAASPLGAPKSAKAQQREYVGEWVALLRECRSDLDKAQAQVLVHAALAVIHDGSRGSRKVDFSIGDLQILATAVLGLSAVD